MEGTKRLIAKLIRRCGYDVYAAGPYPVGREPLRDAKLVLGDLEAPCVFDVGANKGQTLEKVLKYWPSAQVHCFEPAPSLFVELERVAAGRPGVRVNRDALGAVPEEREFHEYGMSVMNSFLPPGADNADVVTNTVTVRADTLDAYCERVGVERIDVLKIDTQGFDLEVLKGASKLLADARVAMILIELNFVEHYGGQARAGEVIDHVVSKDFLPMCFYPMAYRDTKWRLVGQGRWCDAMFLHRSRSIPLA